jgi:hypothetical protein
MRRTSLIRQDMDQPLYEPNPAGQLSCVCYRDHASQRVVSFLMNGVRRVRV